MANKDYREIQLSSAQLAVIFIVILALGVVIFLLGVSVGKKQAQLVKESDLTTSGELQQAQRKSPETVQTKDSIKEEIASHERLKEKTQKKEPAVQRNLYYIQVAALNNREAATSFAEEFKKRGYPAVVFEPFPSDRRAVFRVRIGGYETREEAEKVLNQLRSESTRQIDYFIIRS
ncbi:MAG: SPOR domain-containing protein [Candidatus Aminicenantes bacterium]|nr:MAG: SPOR domain-containing protein [Candidatus Aminicenantes bacterium]